MLGATTLSLPYILAVGGWTMALVLAACSMITLTTAHMLNRSLAATGEETYAALVLATLGPSWRLVLMLAQYVELFFWDVCFIIAAGANMASVFPLASADEWSAILVAATLPAAWIRSYRVLSVFSSVGLLSFTVTLVLVLLKLLLRAAAIVEASRHRHVALRHDWFISAQILAATGMLLGGFSGK